MTLFKRKIGRRAAGVGVGVALLMLGLEGPAFAAAPTVSGIAPTSGPTDCIAVVTGTAFTDSPAAATTVTFDTAAPGVDVDATDFSIISATEIWVRVPALAAGTHYTITITNNGGTASGGSFDSTLGAGGCAPTITSFTPTCGPVDTTVVITGTNLLKGTDPTVAAQQTQVAFFDYTDVTVGTGNVALHTVPNVDTPTSLSVLVPAKAKDGPIRVTTFATAGGTAFSTDPYLLPPPDCKVITPFVRSITLSLRKHLVARGKVSAADATAPAGCVAAVPVKIQRRVSGHWKTVGRTTTSDTGAYKKRIRDRAGKYRSLAPKITLETGEVCKRAVSRAVRHTH